MGSSVQTETPHADWLADHLRDYRLVRDRAASAERRWSLGRLLVFGITAWIWHPLRAEPLLSVAAFIVGLAVFAWTVRRHLVTRERRQFLDRVLLMIEESSSRCGGALVVVRDWRRPAEETDDDAVLPPVLDDGPVWHLTRQERDDLEMFNAPFGLFGLLNRTSTCIGAGRLREVMERPRLSVDHIRRRQDAVGWLADHPDVRLQLMAASAALRNRDRWVWSFVRAVKLAEPLGGPATIAVIRVWGAMCALASIAALGAAAFGSYRWSAIVSVLLVFNVGIYAQMRRRLQRALGPWDHVAGAAGACLKTCVRAARDLPDGGELGSLKSCFAGAADPQVLPVLIRRLAWTNAGGMFHVICNIVFCYDLHVAHAICRRVVLHRDALTRGLAALAELEALNGLACFAWESADGGPTCRPDVSKQRLIAIEGGRHPLIDPREAVPNDLRLNEAEHIWIITGSNMAGKSTFLRMAATNLLLAQLGTVALARELRCCPVRLVTDLQAFDSLADHESYFLAEVRHMRRMVDPPPGGQPILGLIDEPFRGTNSAEQVAAGVAVVEHIRRLPHFFILATHERTLTGLADGRAATNHHFREHLESRRMTFDYVLHPGPARTRNALRVLELERYPEPILRRAREWLDAAGDGGSADSPGDA